MFDIASPLEMALAYADHGWAVFPLIGKVPAIARGHGFLDATTDEQQVRDWWGTVPTWDVGIATGKISGITVVDIDPYNGGMNTIEANGIVFPKTAQVSTQRGFHLYYEYKGKVKSTMGKGIDVKSDGGYVVAPPSVGTHGPYVWQVAMKPAAL